MLEHWYRTLEAALREGSPPLYVQLSAATVIFVALRLYFLWRRRVKNARPPPSEWLAGGWLGVLLLLSLGIVDHLVRLYRDYVITVYNNLIG